MKYLIEYLYVPKEGEVEWGDTEWVDQFNGRYDFEQSRKICMESSRDGTTYRIVIEMPVEWDGDPEDEDTEATDWEYGTYAVYVNGAEWFPNPSPVIIEVLGGVAEVASAPEWLTVEIRDYDNEPKEIGEDE